MSKNRYADLRSQLERLNDPEARYEMGEGVRRAALAALADRWLLELLESYERLELVLVPRADKGQS